MGSLIPNPLQTMNMQAISQLAQGQQPQGQNPGSQQNGGPSQGGMPSPPPGYMNSLLAIHNYHEMKKAVGVEQLRKYDALTSNNIPVDGKAWIKAYKAAGIPVDTSPEAVKHSMAFFQQYQGEKDPMTGQQNEVPKEIAALMEKSKNGTLTKKDIQKFTLESAILGEIRSDRFKGADEQQKAQVQRKYMDYLNTYLDDKNPVEQRYSALAKMGVIAPETVGHVVNELQTSLMTTPQLRQMQVGVAAGLETDAQRLERTDKLVEQGHALGLGDQDARTRADQIAHGQPVTVKMPPMTPQQLQNYVTGVNAAIHRGLTQDRIGHYAQTFVTAGPEAAEATVPTGTKTLEEQQMALEERKTKAAESEARSAQVSAEAAQARAHADETEANTRAAQEKFLQENAGQKLSEEQTKDLIDNFKVLMDADKMGAKLPDDVKQNMIASIAHRSGMHPDRAQHLFGLYSTQTWVPDQVNTGDQGTSQAGAQPNAAALAAASKGDLANPQTAREIGAGMHQSLAGVGPAIQQGAADYVRRQKDAAQTDKDFFEGLFSGNPGPQQK